MNREQRQGGGGFLKAVLAATGQGSVLASLAAIVIGLVAGFAIMLASNASIALPAFGKILTDGFADMKNVGQVLYFSTPILMTGLSVAFANRTGLFNIGASGQFTVGAYCAILVGVKCTFLPGHLHWIVALLAALAAGALWGAVPGILKAVSNVNEVISCIMMNYIGMYLAEQLVILTMFDKLKNQSQRVAATANIPKLGFDKLFSVDGNNYSSANGGIVLAILAAIAIYVVLEKTTFGYELKACGFNRDAARYAGINEKKSIALSMVIAGALSGMGGALLYLAGSGKGLDVVDTLAAEGFNGIPVSLLALNNPIGVVFAALFIAYLNQGGNGMQIVVSSTGSYFPPQVIEIIISIIIYFSAFALVLRGIISAALGGGGKAKAARQPAPDAAAAATAAPTAAPGDGGAAAGGEGAGSKGGDGA